MSDYSNACFICMQCRPLDLCDAIYSSPDVLTVGLQGSQTSSASLPDHLNNQGSLSSVPSNSTGNTMFQGSSGIVGGSSSSLPSTQLNAPAR